MIFYYLMGLLLRALLENPEKIAIVGGVIFLLAALIFGSRNVIEFCRLLFAPVIIFVAIYLLARIPWAPIRVIVAILKVTMDVIIAYGIIDFIKAKMGH